MNDALRDEIAQLYARMCYGLSDPTRILLVYALAERDHNVTNLAEIVHQSQPTVSRHLKVLRELHLVCSERHGRSIIYRLADPRIIEALDLLRGVLSDNLHDQALLATTVNQSLALQR
ncbi:MAG: winged helix-turn-helix transcriptional regulator [Chloroflexi bacterium]|nr:winged helix-turn-helix transcriptional regulator [Chloroflexota bacterium]